MARRGSFPASTAIFTLPIAVSIIGIYERITGSAEKAAKCDSIPKSRLIFVGTGSSTGCPRPGCPLIFSPHAILTPAQLEVRSALESHCKVSNLAMEGGDPKRNRNYRNNPSLLISHVDPRTGDVQNVIIDTGKTFREGALRWLPDNGIASLDTILLTHHHMDAAAGLDDVRGFQHWTGEPPKLVPMPLYLSRECLQELRKQFPWLFPLNDPENHSKVKESDPTKPVVERHVASFEVSIFSDFHPIRLQGLSIIPLPVIHGEDLISYGFAFTVGETNVVYLSDISRMLPDTLDFIQHKLPPTNLLIVDALHPVRRNPVHYNLEEAVALVRQIQPQQVYLVGMNCDSFLPHDEMNAKLKKEYGNIQLAHDGLVIDV